MSSLRRLVILVSACLTSRGAFAQTSAKASSAVGTWRGTSRCLVRPSPCSDEVVVYRITPVGTSDSVTVDARKIVNGREEEMGALGCGVAAVSGQITCTMRNGVWYFTVRGDSLIGELRVPPNTKFRDVRTVRAR